MFAVIFEVRPRPAEQDAYLDNAGRLRPELERIDGFIDNLRYRSLTREGWILSLSVWRDEKSVVRWRTHAPHHAVQEKGRSRILADYHLRVGQIVRDSRLPEGQALVDQRLDATEVGEGSAVILIDATQPEPWPQSGAPADCAARLGLDPHAGGLIGWDLFEAVLTPGELILMQVFKDGAAAEAFEAAAPGPAPAGGRMRRVHVVRDYGMFDRREAPQYYPDARPPQALQG